MISQEGLIRGATTIDILCPMIAYKRKRVRMICDQAWIIQIRGLLEFSPYPIFQINGEMGSKNLPQTFSTLSVRRPAWRMTSNRPYRITSISFPCLYGEIQTCSCNHHQINSQEWILHLMNIRQMRKLVIPPQGSTQAERSSFEPCWPTMRQSFSWVITASWRVTT